MVVIKNAEVLETRKYCAKEEGYEEAKKEFGSLLQTISDQMHECKKELFNRLKPELIELVIAIAERVIRMELSQPEKMAKLIETFLAHPAFEGEIVRIFLSPEDISKIETLGVRRNELRFVTNKEQLSGDVKIETKLALMNFNIARELDDLRHRL